MSEAFSEVALPGGHVLLVDVVDLPILAGRNWLARRGKNTWYAFANERIPGTEKYRTVFLHRLLTAATNGQLVDHENGNGLDNRRTNLRACSTYDNGRNKVLHAAKKRAAGGFIGIYFNKRREKWTACICAGERNEKGHSRRISLGNHETPESAARAYDSAAAHFFGEFGTLNFPDEAPVPYVPFVRDYSKSALLNGESHPGSKITAEVARAIAAADQDLSPGAIAKLFGVTRAIAEGIRSGRTWRSVA